MFVVNLQLNPHLHLFFKVCCNRLQNVQVRDVAVLNSLYSSVLNSLFLLSFHVIQYITSTNSTLHICQIQRVGTECKNRKDCEERTPLSVNIDLFQTDYGCDIEKGSVCTYHPGAVHCVRGIQAR